MEIEEKKESRGASELDCARHVTQSDRFRH